MKVEEAGHFPVPSGRPSCFTEAIDILPGCHVATPYDLHERRLFELRISAGGPIDVFVMDTPSYGAFGGGTSLYRGPGKGAVNPGWSSALGPGRFWLVLENPGTARLTGTAEVRIV